MNLKKLLLVAIALALGVLLALWLKAEVKIDSCLDLGGRWNYDAGKCEMSMGAGGDQQT